jgi:hypothetical protein
VTPAQIIYHRRVQVLDRAGQTSVTEALPHLRRLADDLRPLGLAALSALGWPRCCPRVAGRR